MKISINSILDGIAKLPPNWHSAGSVTMNMLYAIRKYADQLGTIRNSAETGSGKTTLLFSHLSANHLVFAVDAGKSISRVKESPLFNAKTVTFIEGPTQRTLPSYSFNNSVQLILLDGPHGYPFPDLEYFYFYPRLEEGGLLLIDDIHIPSISRMFEILKADDMFNLLEVVENTAFLKRTNAPLFPTDQDGWWLQGYNRSMYEKMTSDK